MKSKSLSASCRPRRDGRLLGLVATVVESVTHMMRRLPDGASYGVEKRPENVEAAIAERGTRGLAG